MEQELNGPWPLHGHDAAIPPMAGWWMAWLNDGSYGTLQQKSIMLWWDGSRWFDEKGQYYPHVGWWAGLVDVAMPMSCYLYELNQKELLLRGAHMRPRINLTLVGQLLGDAEQSSLPFVVMTTRTKITYIPKV